MKAIFYTGDFENSYIPHILEEMYFKKIYEDVKDGKVMVDLGANIGLTTQFLSKKFERVIAVEPCKEHFEALKMNKEHNGWDNVELVQAAISDRDGESILFHNTDNITSHSLLQNNNQGQEEVKVMRIDTLLGDTEVDFMKVDIESAEDILFYSEGFKKVAPQIKSMLVEFHTNDRNELRAKINKIKRLGFYLKGWKMQWMAYCER